MGNPHKSWVGSSETAKTEADFLTNAIPDVHPAGQKDGEPSNTERGIICPVHATFSLPINVAS